ncbi:MAG: guanylate kinase [Candidatus Lightella neohaematopini]|nr:guanylate kinase [Candidatus Lightella neohaematopini]MCV2528899.1 guanylate kinase [Candidatus Lightella neohaematopini]
MLNYSIIYIISAPSGTGKSSLIKSFIKNKLLKNITISISYTTRKKRIGEKHGEHYFFISVKEFKEMIKRKFFLEYAIVFGNYYGTTYTSIKNLVSNNTSIILNIDWQGARQVKNKLPNVCSIFIIPPSIKELNNRLYLRGQDSVHVIKNRINQFYNDIKYCKEYNYLIVNDNFELTLKQLKAIIIAEQLKIKYQKNNYLLNQGYLWQE